jgi:hypothetical protein
MDYQVAIPSYQRAEHLEVAALSLLLAGGVDPARITIFLHDNDPQRHDYLVMASKVGVGVQVTAARGITAQRTAILNHYPAGTLLLSVDDDVTRIREAVDKKTLRDVTDLDALFRTMFMETMARGLYVWGLSPVPNAYFMKPGEINDGLKFLIFTVWGCVVRHDHPVHTFTVPYKDEHELSLRAWWYDGATVRHDGVAANANYYTAPGGCQAAGRDLAQVEASVVSLLEQWPGLVRRNLRRKSDWPEIVLATRKRHAGHPVDVEPPGIYRPS